MLIYFLTLIIVVFLGIQAEKFKDYKYTNKFFLAIIFFVLVIVEGFRNRTVGTDTAGYVRRFLSNEHDISDLFNSEVNVELGYRFIEIFAAQITNEYFILLIVIAIISIYFQLKGIYKISVTPELSLFIYIAFCIYTFPFNGIRQGIAASIYIYAMLFLVKRNFLKYCLWVFIAYLFHKSIIVAIPLYFVFRTKFGFKLFGLMILATGLIIVFFDKVLNFGILISDKYAVYAELNATGGKLLTVFYVLLSIFFVISRNVIKLKYRTMYDTFLNMFLTGTIVFVVVMLTGVFVELTRLGTYFLTSALFLWPMIFKSYKKVHLVPLYAIFGIAHLLYFYVFLSKMANLSPYKFNSELFIF